MLVSSSTLVKSFLLRVRIPGHRFASLSDSDLCLWNICTIHKLLFHLSPLYLMNFRIIKTFDKRKPYRWTLIWESKTFFPPNLFLLEHTQPIFNFYETEILHQLKFLLTGRCWEVIQCPGPANSFLIARYVTYIPLVFMKYTSKCVFTNWTDDTSL